MKKRFKYSAEQIGFLRAGYQSMNVHNLARAFNARFGTDQSWSAIKSVLQNHRITCGRAGKDRLRPLYLAYTVEQAEFIRRKYTVLSLSDLTVQFNAEFRTCKTESQIKAFIRNHKIKSGRTGRYEKGNVPWLAGTVGLTGANPGSFKKGRPSLNEKPLGWERVDTHGYVWIKIAEPNPYTTAPTRHKQKHVHLWERDNGPVPPGKVVIFRDGDKLNFEPENLMLVTRAELLRLNKYGYKEMPAALKPSVLALAKLETKTFALARRGDTE